MDCFTPLAAYLLPSDDMVVNSEGDGGINNTKDVCEETTLKHTIVCLLTTL